MNNIIREYFEETGRVVKGTQWGVMIGALIWAVLFIAVVAALM